jgi:hypothetical protein
MILEPNYRLKAEIIAKYGTLTNGAREFQKAGLSIDHFRLSRLIHGRGIPTPKEKRMIAWKLQRSIDELFNNPTL